MQTVGGIIAGYVLPPIDGTGLKFAAGTNKHLAHDPGACDVTNVVTCAYTFTEDHKFFSRARGRGRGIVVSACSGHGYKFGAAVGRRLAQAVCDDDTGRLNAWLRAELPPQARVS